MEELQSWLFHYNPYEKIWSAFKREHSSDYFNGIYDNALRSKNHRTLEELIITYKGDIKKINKMVSSDN